MSHNFWHWKDHSDNCIVICQEFFKHANKDKNFMKRTVKDLLKSIWKQKAVFNNSLEKNSQRSKKAPKNIEHKVMMGFFILMVLLTTKLIVIVNCYCGSSWFLLLGQTMICQYYLEVLKHLREKSGEKDLSCGGSTTWFLHHDNVPAHALVQIVTF